MDERIILVIIPVIILWCIMIPSHRHQFIKADKINVGQTIASLAGSKTNYVVRYAFGLQLGYLSIIFWYTIFHISNIPYFISNAYVFAILSGGLTGLVLQKILKFFAH